jgi:DNA polymerase III sliding clamp (beta) subunit (PCNA family)
MELKLDKKDFAETFLDVVSRTVDTAAIKVSKDGLYVIAQTPNSTVFLLGKYVCNIDIEQEMSLNLGDIKKLLRVLDCVEDESLTFKINSNHLHYKSPSIQFKYHFLDDAIMPKTSYKREKIEALQYDTYFDVEYKKLQEVLKVSSFTADTNKLYLFQQDGCIFCELGDKERFNTDNISLKLVDTPIEGQPLPKALPFNLDIFRALAGVRFSKARVGINYKHNIMSFLVKPTDQTEFRFIISGLVK